MDRLTPTILKSMYADECSALTPRALVKALTQKKVLQVCAGNEHSVALTNDGNVYIWYAIGPNALKRRGGNSDGQLGFKCPDGMQLTPNLLLSLHQINIRRIACGTSHTLALSSRGMQAS